MRLSDQQLRVLKAVEFSADLTIAELAARCRMQPHSVAYCVGKLRESGILGPVRAAINTYRLGFSDFHFVFSLATGNAAKRGSFLSALQGSPSVAWFAEVGGPHQLALSIRVKQVHEALSFMRGVTEKFPNLIRGQQLSIVRSISSFGREYLYGKHRAAKSFTNRAAGLGSEELDSIDYRILNGLSELEHSSQRELARLLGLSFSTVRRRIELLEKASVINGYYHHIDAVKLGYQVYKLLIFARSQDVLFLRELEKFAASHENAVHYLECMGSWQNEIVVEVREALQASQIATAIQEKFEAQIDSVHVIPIFRHFKASSFPGLGEARSKSSDR